MDNSRLQADVGQVWWAVETECKVSCSVDCQENCMGDLVESCLGIDSQYSYHTLVDIC